jgi:hypothetical protein
MHGYAMSVLFASIAIFGCPFIASNISTWDALYLPQKEENCKNSKKYGKEDPLKTNLKLSETPYHQTLPTFALDIATTPTNTGHILAALLELR